MTREPSPAAVRGKCEGLMRSKWFMPLFCLGLGVGVFVASWLGGHLGAGLVSLAVMAGFGLFLLLVASSSETIRGLTFGRDERFAQIDLRATAVAGLAVLMALIVAWLVAVAQGHSGSPYGWLLAIGGLAYMAAVAFFRWRG
ncbi:MAG TPA: hypothetical protein VGS19_25545 [Streptosporangiaceae bacterium]|nr:hypothetical protein [Streptosporangiaceae bacterium]